MTTKILIEFKKNLIDFMDELISQFPQEGDLVILRIYLKDQAIIQDIMETLILNLNKDEGKIKKMIKDRNEIFFLEYSLFNEKVGKNKVAHFKKLWRSGLLDKDDKQIFWQWMDSFVFFSKKYLKNKS
tara:strand:- start:1034 stop:1417 length:384 start_codon:yes stop_codon:yes gene_type:complete